MIRTRVLKIVRGAAGAALLTGGLGVIGAVGFGLATGAPQAGATTVSGTSTAFTLTCDTVPVVTTLSLPTSTVKATLSPSPVPGGTDATISDLHFSVAVKKSLAAVAEGDTITVRSKMIGTITGGTPTTVTIHFTGTVHVPTSTSTIPSTGLPVTLTGTATPAAVTADATGTLTLGLESSTITKVSTRAVLADSNTTVGIELGTSTVGTFACSNTAATVVSDSILHVGPLAITTTSLPSGKVNHAYTATLVASGGTGVYTWSSTTLPAGLSLDASTGKITGVPSAAGKTTVTFTVRDGKGTSVTKTLAITIAATTGIPPITQPFQETVHPGTLTLSCTRDVTSETTAVKTCTLIHLSPVTLNEKPQKALGLMNDIYVSTARGNPTVGWSLSAVMVPTSATLNTDATCASVQGFCDSSVGTHASTAARGQIPATHFAMGNWACMPNTTATYNNVNPAPTKGTTGTLKTALTLCTSKVGESGGAFTIGSLKVTDPAGFELTVPPTIYAGTYYGTVEYTVVSTS